MNILNPETAINPYNVRHTPPITQEGMVRRIAISGLIKDITMHIIAAVKIV